MNGPGNITGRNVIHALTGKVAKWSSTLGILLVVGVVLGPPLRQAVVDIQLLYRVQDEILVATPQGQRYIDMFYSNGGEITSLLQANPTLRAEAMTVVELWQPNLQALVDGDGAKSIIKRSQVQAIVQFLDHLSAAGSPALQQVISTERARKPLELVAGLSMEQACAYLMDQACPVRNNYTLTWLPPLNTGDPYYLARVGTTIPIEFTIRDRQGRPVIDHSATLTIMGPAAGPELIGPLGVGVDPMQAVIFQGGKYHYDFQTTGLIEGSYSAIVYYDSTSASVNFGLTGEYYIP